MFTNRGSRPWMPGFAVVMGEQWSQDCLPQVAGGDERAPVERVGAESLGSTFAKDAQTGGSNRFGSVQLVAEARTVQRRHPLAGCLVVDRPQAHDHRPDTGDLKRATQAKNAFAAVYLAEPRIACREDRPFGAVEVQRGNLLGGQNAVL